MLPLRGLIALAVFLWCPALSGKETDRQVSAELGGVGLVAVSGSDPFDPRLGSLAAGFARAGYESFVAADVIRPPVDAERQLVRARRALDDARRYRRNGRLKEAIQAGDLAISGLEQCANEAPHLRLLVEALAERGASAFALGDTAKAETVFLRAIAQKPQYELDETLYEPEVRRLFSEVRRASRQLRYGSLRVNVAHVENAKVSINFGSWNDPPYQTKLPDGRHFVSASGSGRYEVVALVAVRAGRQTELDLRPPLSGDVRNRADALSRFESAQPSTISHLAKALGLRFIGAVVLSRSNLSLELMDGKTGQSVPSTKVVLSVNPSQAEVDAATSKVIAAIRAYDPNIARSLEDASPWYASWWAISLAGLVVAGAAGATAFALTRDSETDYRFRP